MNPILLAFEAELALGPTFAARLLGVAYPTYAHYRSGKRELPLYHYRHVETFLALSASERARLVKDHAHATGE